MADPNDTKALLESAQGGSREAFEALVRRFDRRIDGLIARRLGAELRGAVEPEDVKQEALLRAYQGIARFEWRGEDSLLHWIGGLVEHVVLKAHERARYRRSELLDEGLAAPQVSPSRGLRREERFERLERALESLSPEHREVILLARVEKLPGCEIARRMSRSPAAVAQLLSRALRKLRDVFGNTESLSLPRRTLGGERGSDEGK